MLVSITNFDAVIANLLRTGAYGLDTETTGLGRSDRLFSIIVADDTQAYYFSFNDSPDHLGEYVPEEYRLPRRYIERMFPVFENHESFFFAHNAKFDLSMLAKDGVAVLGTMHCTEAHERVLRNNYFGNKPYSLASCAARRGFAKDASVEEYIKKHKLYTKTKVPGKAKVFEQKHFDKVPFSIIAPYGEIDATLTRVIGLQQCQSFLDQDQSRPINEPSIEPLIANDHQLTKVCHRIEEAGIHIDREYVEGALSYTLDLAETAKQSFLAMTCIPYQDSATVFKKAFEKLGIALPLTAKGNVCTNKETLDALENPLAEKIREIRSLEKLCSTYYSSFLYFADKKNLIHANMRQAGTETGRFSYSDPNLQNLPKEDEEDDRLRKYLVRRCFTPINSDYCFVPIDYEQQEFRMLLDYAGESAVIAAIMAGTDVHEATAQMVGTTRKKAKTLNFGLLYGMGAAKLAKALKISLAEAHELRHAYFAKLPKVRLFIDGVMNTGGKRGYIRNWFGFRNHLSSPEFAYVLPNHLIQGGCAQVIRVAMVRIDAYIREHRLRTQMLAQVHDELLFQVHKDELQHVPNFKKIMEDVYQPRNGLYLTCSVEHSWKSWAKFDMTKGVPDGPKAGDTVQKTRKKRVRKAA